MYDRLLKIRFYHFHTPEKYHGVECYAENKPKGMIYLYMIEKTANAKRIKRKKTVALRDIGRRVKGGSENRFYQVNQID